MSVKSLGFEEIQRRATNFRETVESNNPVQDFTVSSEAEHFLLENALAPIIGTICDQQVSAEDAWSFPYWLSQQMSGGKFSPSAVCALGKTKVEKLLNAYMKPKWPAGMNQSDRDSYSASVSSYIVTACEVLDKQYADDPDTLFEQRAYTPSEIYFLLRGLPGFGQKKAAMISRDFALARGSWYKGLLQRVGKKSAKLRVIDKHLAEVPIDVHVVKVFGRIVGEFKKVPSRDQFLGYLPDIQNFAKLVFPEFPAGVDDMLWTVGRTYCHSSSPDCQHCPLADIPCDYSANPT